MGFFLYKLLWRPDSVLLHPQELSPYGDIFDWVPIKLSALTLQEINSLVSFLHSSFIPHENAFRNLLSEHESSYEKWNAKKECLEGQIEDLRRNLGMKERELQEVKKEVEKEISREREAAIHHIEKLETALRKERDEKNHFKSLLLQEHSVDRYLKVDSDFLESMSSIKWNIRNWCRGQQLPWNQLLMTDQDNWHTKHTFQFFEVVTPSYADVMKLQNVPNLLLEAYIWHQLHQEIFVENLWAGLDVRLINVIPASFFNNVTGSYKQLAEHLKPKAKNQGDEIDQFQECRSTTVRMLHNIMKGDEYSATIANIRKKCLFKIHNIATLREFQFDVEGLDEIVNATMQLVIGMKEQRAEWQFVRFEESDVFVSDYMIKSDLHQHDDPSVSQEYVGFSIAPGLVKSGTSEGKNYQIKLPVLKAELFMRPTVPS